VSLQQHAERGISQRIGQVLCPAQHIRASVQLDDVRVVEPDRNAAATQLGDDRGGGGVPGVGDVGFVGGVGTEYAGKGPRPGVAPGQGPV
jgi:hypothetical protein